MPDLDPEHHAYHRWLVEEKGVDPAAVYGGLAGFCGAGVPAELHQTTWCTEMAIRFVREPRDGPWLLSLNPFDPHPPFDPPAAFLERYDPSSLPPPLFRASDLERQKAPSPRSRSRPSRRWTPRARCRATRARAASARAAPTRRPRASTGAWSRPPTTR